MPAKKKSAWSLAAEAMKQNIKTPEQESGETEEMQSVETVEPQNMEAVKLSPIETGEHDSGETPEQENIEVVEQQTAITVKTESGKAKKKQSKKTGKPQSVIADAEEDKPTEKITLYLTWKQLDKLDQMALEYKRRTRKRTDHNKLMRMMVDKFELDDLL